MKQTVSQTTCEVPFRPCKSILDRFAKYVTRGEPDECWLWTGAIARNGYGRIRHGKIGQRHLTMRAHRVAWMIYHEKHIPIGMYILHKCPGGGTKLCCNPNHLAPGTAKENTRDALISGRYAFGDRNGSRLYPERRPRGDTHWARMNPDKVPRGEQCGKRCKLSDAQAAEIRVLYATKQHKQIDLAAQFNVDQTTISRIVLMKRR